MDLDPDYSPDEDNYDVAAEAEQEESEGALQSPFHSSGDEAEGEGADESSLSEEGDERPPLKRRGSDNEQTPRPFKRQKGVFNNDYLDLLNCDIRDAAQRFCSEDQAEHAPSQLGLTFWSASEKQLLYEAVARLGRHDMPGIASRIGSKNVLEVNQYIDSLRDARRQRREGDRHFTFGIHDLPIAVEISQQCCHAQEEAADAISVRQESREQQREESKWGDEWDVTPQVAQKFDRRQDGEAEKPPFSELFHLARWLQLSRRIFMNSSIPGDNWNFIDTSPPSVWAATFGDFHSLAVSITRRLVQTILFITMSRIRVKSELEPDTRHLVKRGDVEAAVASLGLDVNSQGFWRKSARRLRLSVFEDPLLRGGDGDGEPMTYDDVEQALSEETPESTFEAIHDALNLDSPSDEDTGMSQNSGSEQPVTEDEEEYEIDQEADEVLTYSALDFPDTHRARQALRARIAEERQQEQYADRLDDHASSLAEADMWDLLQKRPPMELPKWPHPGPPRSTNMNVESVYPGGRDWGNKLEYHSEWETMGSKEQDQEAKTWRTSA